MLTIIAMVASPRVILFPVLTILDLKDSSQAGHSIAIHYLWVKLQFDIFRVRLQAQADFHFQDNIVYYSLCDYACFMHIKPIENIYGILQ